MREKTLSQYQSAAWNTGPIPGGDQGRRKPRRALEIAGIVIGFIWFWPLAVAYLGWKFMGYPRKDEARVFLQDRFGKVEHMFNCKGRDFSEFKRNFSAGGFAAGFGSTGNAAFDDYRRKELERLEQERRRLDDEAREFSSFVEELKRAKDREEFDAYMAKRRSDNTRPTDV
jgi:hypothetical protein